MVLSRQVKRVGVPEENPVEREPSINTLGQGVIVLGFLGTTDGIK
jgi:hypothetical protein